MTEEGNEDIERWLKVLNNVVIVVRTSVLFSMSLHTSSQYYLFSAVVAALLTLTIRDFRQDPHSISRISIGFKHSQTPTHLSLPRRLILLDFLLHNVPSG